VDTGRPTSIQAFVEDLKVANNVWILCAHTCAGEIMWVNEKVCVFSVCACSSECTYMNVSVSVYMCIYVSVIRCMSLCEYVYVGWRLEGRSRKRAS
jgi:hypothetical protein